MDDERSERTRSVPSVASRRVAAPYGVDDLALKRSISSKKVLNFKARYSLGPALRKRNVKKRGPDLARRRAKKNTEPVRV